MRCSKDRSLSCSELNNSDVYPHGIGYSRFPDRINHNDYDLRALADPNLTKLGVLSTIRNSATPASSAFVSSTIYHYHPAPQAYSESR